MASIGISNQGTWGEFLEKPSRWFYGLGFGVNFVPNGFSLNSGGTVAYRIKRKTFVGVNPNFSFLFQRLPYENTNAGTKDYYLYTSTYLESSVYLRHFFRRRVFMQLEPGIINYKSLDNIYFDPNLGNVVEFSERITAPYGLAGLGYLAPIGENSFFVIRCQYDVLGKDESPYKGLPVIRGGINFSF